MIHIGGVNRGAIKKYRLVVLVRYSSIFPTTTEVPPYSSPNKVPYLGLTVCGLGVRDSTVLLITHLYHRSYSCLYKSSTFVPSNIMTSVVIGRVLLVILIPCTTNPNVTRYVNSMKTCSIKP